MYICNAFSLQMLGGPNADVEVRKMTINDVKVCYGNIPLQSAIGHADTAKVISNLLGIELAANRVYICLADHEELLVAQLTGGRLPEGATTLPKGFEVEFYRIRVKYCD